MGTNVQQDLVSLDILKKRDGIYCKKEDKSGDVVKFAFITSDAMMLAIWEKCENPTTVMFYWNENEIESHEKIVNFLSEVAFRPLYEKGKPIEQEKARLMWQICMDCSQIPKDFINCIKSLKNIIS